jgi:predicted nuclease with TOPRIM domain
MTSPERAQLLRDIERSSDLRSEITRRLDDEGYDLQGKWEELEKLDLEIHRQIKVIFMKNKQSE